LVDIRKTNNPLDNLIFAKIQKLKKIAFSNLDKMRVKSFCLEDFITSFKVKVLVKFEVLESFLQRDFEFRALKA